MDATSPPIPPSAQTEAIPTRRMDSAHAAEAWQAGYAGWDHRKLAEALLTVLEGDAHADPFVIGLRAIAHAALAIGQAPPPGPPPRPRVSPEAVYEQVAQWCAHMDPESLERACRDLAGAAGAEGVSPFAALPAVLERAAAARWMNR